jgi:hypothetical protein
MTLSLDAARRFFTGLLIGLLAAPVLSAADELNYRVRFRSGEPLSGKTLEDHFFVHGNDSVKLDGQSILRLDQPVAEIRRLNLVAKRSGAFLAFDNGDSVPAKLVEAPVDSETFHIALTPPLSGKLTPVVAVSQAATVRIVADGAEQRWRGEGELWLTNGRLLRPRSVRWRGTSFRILSEAGVTTLPLSDLQEWQAPPSPISRGTDAGTGHMVRLQMANGAVLTCPESRLKRGTGDAILIQPFWAKQAIRVSSAQIVSMSYWALDELPLSTLPMAQIEQNSYSGFLWPWRRDQNARGKPLRSGKMIVAMGFSAHSYSVIEAVLPATAERFSCWVGLDPVVGDGGCVKCSIRSNSVDGELLWQSGFIQGGDPPVRIDGLPLAGVERLVFVTDFGHEGRPEGADPFDIRDAVNWMEPLVKLTAPPQTAAVSQPDERKKIRALNGWVFGKTGLEHIRTVSVWDSHNAAWCDAVRLMPPPVLPRGADNAVTFTPDVPPAPGVRYDYYKDFVGAKLPDFTKMTPTASGVISTVSLDIPGRVTENWAARYQALLLVPRDGDYVFYMSSDDGSKLYFNNIKIIDIDGHHGTQGIARQLRLKKGAIALKVEFFQGGGPCDLNLFWEGPGVNRQEIPTAFYRASDDIAVQKIDEAYITNISSKEMSALVLQKDVKITPSNAQLVVGASAADGGDGGYVFTVAVNDVGLQSLGQGDLQTHAAGAFQDQSRTYGMGAYLGQRVKLQVFITPTGSSGWMTTRPLLIRKLALQPLVANVGRLRKIEIPDIPLSSILPRIIALPKAKLENGKTVEGTPLELLGIIFENGYGVPQESEIAYDLEGTWRRFVAVVNSQDGPYELYLDDALHWSSGDGAAASLWQVNVKIPPDHNTMRLKFGEGTRNGVWAKAGFMLK